MRLVFKQNLLILTFILVTMNSYGQILDSIIYEPFDNIDSIAYWHKPEIKNEKNYMTFGIIKYCSCDYHSFLKQSDYKSQDTIPTSEGYLENGTKNGEWTYWNNVKRICCDEFHLYPDSLVIYENGLKIEKTDRYGTHHYFGDRIRIEIVVNDKYPYAVECDKDSCEIVYCDKFVIEKFDKKYLDLEIEKVAIGEYNFEAKKASDNLKERQEKYE